MRILNYGSKFTIHPNHKIASSPQRYKTFTPTLINFWFWGQSGQISSFLQFRTMWWENLAKSSFRLRPSILPRSTQIQLRLLPSSLSWAQVQIHLFLWVLSRTLKRRTSSRYRWDKAKVQLPKRWFKKAKRQANGLCYRIATCLLRGCLSCRKFVRSCPLTLRLQNQTLECGWLHIHLTSSRRLFYKMVWRWQMSLQKV